MIFSEVVKREALMEQNPSNSSRRTRTDRKTTEKNRRNNMKALCARLHSLVPHHTSREAMLLSDQLDEAANYIKNLEKHLEKMKKKKDSLMANKKPNIASMTSTSNGGLRPRPQIEVHEMGSALEVVLITGLDDKFMFKETISVLQEEGVEVVNAGFSVVESTIFHTIHSKVGESGMGCGAARISERLKKFIR